MLLLFIRFAITRAAILFSYGRVRCYAWTDYLHVLKLIGWDCTAFGIDCTAYLCNVSFRYVRVQVWYEYTFDTSSVHRPAFSWDCDMPHLPFLGCDDYELYLAGLLHWPQDGVNVQISLCLSGVNEVKVKKKKFRYYIVLERAHGLTLLDCNYADTCFTVARGYVLSGGCTQVPHRTSLFRHGAGPTTVQVFSGCSWSLPRIGIMLTLSFASPHDSERGQVFLLEDNW